MIELYTWMTDNGYKARHMAEESGLPYVLKPVNLRNKEQFAPAFLKISPGHKIPAIVDTEGPGGQRITLCESGAILKYLGEKSATGLYPSDPVRRVAVDQWLFYGSATFTTLAQQFGHWVIRTTEDVPPAKKHYEAVLHDMLATLDGHLATNDYMAGGYSVADIAIYADVHVHGTKDIGLALFPNVKRWHDAIAARPAVVRAWTPY
ncbi:MAG: glutathione S-transferase family protein [Alphaproteobacteria bacterium]|nr:glutathione S-transferase family protein [Alphaproteobacteria bacterium]